MQLRGCKYICNLWVAQIYFERKAIWINNLWLKRQFCYYKWLTGKEED